MKIKESFEYVGADVESVYALTSSKEFRIETCVEQGASEHEVTVEPNDRGGDTVTIVRTMPADMPDFIKKVTGDTVKVKQTETWGPADASGRRTADVKVKIIGQPAEMTGQSVLEADDVGTSLSLDGDIKVSIPFLGKKIEPEIAKAIRASLKAEVELGSERL